MRPGDLDGGSCSADPMAKDDYRIVLRDVVAVTIVPPPPFSLRLELNCGSENCGACGACVRRDRRCMIALVLVARDAARKGGIDKAPQKAAKPPRFAKSAYTKDGEGTREVREESAREASFEEIADELFRCGLTKTRLSAARVERIEKEALRKVRRRVSAIALELAGLPPRRNR